MRDSINATTLVEAITKGHQDGGSIPPASTIRPLAKMSQVVFLFAFTSFPDASL